MELYGFDALQNYKENTSTAEFSYRMTDKLLRSDIRSVFDG